MELSSELLSQFAKATKVEEKPSAGVTVTGTAVEYGGDIYVRLDGSDQLTPVISSTAGMKDGDRVTVLIKNHSATVTGNTSSPSAGSGDIEDAKTEIGNKITEVEILIADKVSTTEFDAEKARIDELVADNVTIKDTLNANEAIIGDLEADRVIVNEKLEAAEAEIDDLKATKIDAEIVESKYATIENLEATNANIHNLESDYGSFKDLTTDKFEAQEAEIGKLDTEKLSAEQASIIFANIDFANIGKAAIENFFAKSGMIGDLVVGDGTITGTLVGVTIKGDLIEGGTVVADKLVIKGTDGLYYKLNTDGEKVGAEQTEYNSLNGSVITAKSITAEKVNVKDLVAFDATIGGFNITEDSIYSGVKESVNNTTRGVYLDDTGQVAFGDQNNFLKYFKDSDGVWKLAISAGSIKLGSSNKDLESTLGTVVVSSVEQFYKSDSPITLSGGSWSTSQPEWEEGKYIWRRTAVTHGDGSSEYTPSANGVCITGNNGSDGKGIKSTSITYQAGSSQTSPPTSTWVSSIPTLSADKPYLWTRTILTYSDNSTTTSHSVSSTIDSIEIGGRNLWLNSSFNSGLESYTLTPASGTIEVDDEKFNSNNVLVLSRSGYSGTTRHYVSTKEPPSISSYNSGDSFILSAMIYVETKLDGENNNIMVRGSKGDYPTITIPSSTAVGKWIKMVSPVFTATSDGTFTSGYVLLGKNGVLKVSQIKLEYGNKATDWTPAPEDVQQGIDDAQSSADEAYENSSENEERISAAELDIDSINASIATLVTDENGTSLMHQEGNSWRFDISAITGAIEDAKNVVEGMTGTVDNLDHIVSNLDSLIDDISKKTAYIILATDSKGNPCIELGKEGEAFKTRITNTSMDFMEGSSRIAYVSNKTLYIEKAIIKNELQIGDTGGFVLKTRSNGNMGIRWVEGG